MEKTFYILLILFIIVKSAYSQDSCYIKATLKSDTMVLTCKNQKSIIAVKTIIEINKTSLILQLNMMGHLKHGYFVITKVQSCIKTEADYEYIYEAEEYNNRIEDAITSGKSLIKITKNKLEILPAKKTDCTTEFILN